jgi:Zn-finger nucleic acid-binding protein
MPSTSSLKGLRVTSSVRRNKRKISKSVRFEAAAPQMIAFEQVSEEERDAVWYDTSELEKLCKQEVTQNREAQKKTKKSSLEELELTWRGLEHVQKGTSRNKKSLTHVKIVVECYEYQLGLGYVDMDRIKSVAKHHSKQERARARTLGLKDADAAKDLLAGEQKANRKDKRTSFFWFKMSPTLSPTIVKC